MFRNVYVAHIWECACVPACHIGYTWLRYVRVSVCVHVHPCVCIFVSACVCVRASECRCVSVVIMRVYSMGGE